MSGAGQQAGRWASCGPRLRLAITELLRHPRALRWALAHRVQGLEGWPQSRGLPVTSSFITLDHQGSCGKCVLLPKPKPDQ